MSAPNGSSYWDGIPQSRLTGANRDHIDLLCSGLNCGPWNVSIRWDRVEFGSPYSTHFNLRSSGLSTFDDDQLTRLVFAAHDRCVRLTISPKMFTHLEISMHSGRTRGPDLSTGHPTLEQAVSKWSGVPSVVGQQRLTHRGMTKIVAIWNHIGTNYINPPRMMLRDDVDLAGFVSRDCDITDIPLMWVCTSGSGWDTVVYPITDDRVMMVDYPKQGNTQ